MLDGEPVSMSDPNYGEAAVLIGETWKKCEEINYTPSLHGNECYFERKTLDSFRRRNYKIIISMRNWAYLIYPDVRILGY